MDEDSLYGVFAKLDVKIKNKTSCSSFQQPPNNSATQ